MVSTLKIVDTKSGSPSAPFRVRTNRTGRRTYSPEYKLEIVDECSVPGVSVAAVALTHRINANLVRRWIVRHRIGRLARAPSPAPEMLPVMLSAPSAGVPLATAELALPGSKHAMPGVIEIELEAARIRVRGSVDAAALRTVIDVLAKR
jgi:transposase